MVEGGLDDDAGVTGDDESLANAEAGSPVQYARQLEALDAGVYVLDTDETLTFVNDRLCGLTGYDREDLLGASPEMVLAPETVAAFEREIRRQRDERSDSSTIARRTVLTRADGESVPCRCHLTVLRVEDGEMLGSVGIVRDVSPRERRARLLSRLQETSQSLMQAQGRRTVAEIAADAAVGRLGFEACVVRLYDAEEGTLVPVAATGRGTPPAEELSTVALEEGPTAEVFTSGEPAVYGDVADGASGAGDGEDWAAAEDAAVSAAAVYPIGTHGTVALGVGRGGTVDAVDRRIAGLLATNAAAACNRAKREREVRNAREHVAAIVDRIEGLVEETIEVLVGATTRAELERGVCECLAATEPYAAAWLARPTVQETALVAGEVAGRAEFSVTEPRIDLSGETPGAVAYREGATQVVDAATLEAAEDGWLARAHAEGVAAVAAIPLANHRSRYGVLVVCADRPDAFDDRELVVLEALGRAAAGAIDAIESGRILETDEVVELAVAVVGGTLFDRVSDRTGAALATVGTRSAEESLRLFVTAAGADAAAVGDALVADRAVVEASLVAELEEEALFDLSVEDAVLADLVDRGAVPQRVATEDDGTRVTVEVPDERAARETFAFLDGETEGAALIGYREHERPVHTPQEFRAGLADRFTDRQETALRTAYHGGYFDWPRGADGDELAAGMDISRPTYHQHLRAAQRKVFEELFAAESSLR
jgi:PAS domain S-box-containing protein